MNRTISISPLTRIEGHLAIHTETEKAPGGHRVTAARCEGEMFRGFEEILRGRDPLDAQQVTQRICGVCPVSHGIASVRAQEMAYGITPNHNGRLLQNLVLAANYLQSHVLHFYHLAALDFVDVTAVLKYRGKDRRLRDLRDWVEQALSRGDVFPAAPFLPRCDGDYVSDPAVNWGLLGHYVQALDIRRTAHEMAAVFGAKMPHATSIVPGGVTQVPTLERVLAYRSRLEEILAFVEDVYVPDIMTAAGAFPRLWDVGRGPGNMLSYGVFEMDAAGERFLPPGVIIAGAYETFDPEHIAEEVGYSRFSSASGRHPYRGETTPAPHKEGAYSWVKAPRYQGKPMEVGPLARVLTAYHSGRAGFVRRDVDAVLARTGLPARKLDSVLGRHLARGLEAVWIGRQALKWLDEIAVDEAPAATFEVPETGRGYGLTEAPRGALGHWLSINGRKIDGYQCIVPTTWNCSPRDDRGVPGPVESALAGTFIADADAPIDVARIVRSFDPCLACAVH